MLLATITKSSLGPFPGFFQSNFFFAGAAFPILLCVCRAAHALLCSRGIPSQRW